MHFGRTHRGRLTHHLCQRSYFFRRNEAVSLIVVKRKGVRGCVKSAQLKVYERFIMGLRMRQANEI